MTTKKKFYEKGLRFTCRGSGKCCATRGKYAYVYASFNDRKRIAALLGMSEQAFRARFTKKSDGRYHLHDGGKDCPFFQERRCTVYEARPRQCRTWPFWPENMDATVWEKEVLSYCPGAGTGRLYKAEEIEEILKRGGEVK